MKDLEARKKLLVAESEVYRQTFRLDIQNIRLYGMRVRRKWANYAALKPIFLAGFPLASAFMASRKGHMPQPRSLVSSVIAGWKMYQRLQPLITTLVARYMAPGVHPASADTPEGENEEPAAVI